MTVQVPSLYIGVSLRDLHSGLSVGMYFLGVYFWITNDAMLSIVSVFFGWVHIYIYTQWWMSLWDAMAEYPKYGWRPALIKSIPRLRLVEPALFVSSVIPCLFVKPNVFFDVNAPFGLQPLIPLFSKRARIMLKCVTSRLFCWIQVSLEKNQCWLREHLQATSGNYGSLSLSMILR